MVGDPQHIYRSETQPGLGNCLVTWLILSHNDEVSQVIGLSHPPVYGERMACLLYNMLKYAS